MTFERLNQNNVEEYIAYLKAAMKEEPTISRQAIGICIVPVATEYRTAEFYDRKKGRNVHSAFPCGVITNHKFQYGKEEGCW